MRRHFWALGLSVIVAFSVSPSALAVTDTGLLTSGGHVYVYPDAACPTGFYVFGYEPVIPIGSYAPTTLAGGKTLIALAAQHTCGSEYMYMTIGGFSSDPGINWLVTWKCEAGGYWITPEGYEYDSSTGRATWLWFEKIAPWGGDSTVCTIVHE